MTTWVLLAPLVAGKERSGPPGEFAQSFAFRLESFQASYPALLRAALCFVPADESGGDRRGGRALAEVLGGGDGLVAGAGEKRIDDGVHVGLVEEDQRDQFLIRVLR